MFLKYRKRMSLYVMEAMDNQLPKGCNALQGIKIVK